MKPKRIKKPEKKEEELKEAVYQGPLSKYKEQVFKIRKESDGSNTVIINEKEGRKIVEVPDSDLRFVGKSDKK